ncbi:very-long-chain 3-oxoacyl-CoA reductase-A-like [Oncorhynchus masou masou]|uniref:very-long-chain 3-oxoacyl-CoA reductase-A-like n=1 Tax=Oncorhynchus masou masou TaxID=90313 RepID=UPI0031835E96
MGSCDGSHRWNRESLCREEEQYKVETKTIAVDFGLSDIYPKIEAGLAGLEIGVLVNNVGVSYPYPEYFLHIPDLDNFITNMINVNMTSVCQMTRLVLPRMVQSCGCAFLFSQLPHHPAAPPLLLSSPLSLFPILTSCFSIHTKCALGLARTNHMGSLCQWKGPKVWSSTSPLLVAFVDFFSRGLQEYKAKGIIVQSVLPFVATKMTRIKKPTLDKPTPERYVAAELNTIGLQGQTNGYFPIAVMIRTVRLFLDKSRAG